MPELPEVTTIVNSLKSTIVGRPVKGVWTDSLKMLQGITFEDLEKTLVGKSFTNVDRRGKNILLEIGKTDTLWIHLKMTGHLLLRPTSFFKGEDIDFSETEKKSTFSEKVNQYIHFRFILDNNEELAFSDMRKFGRIRYNNLPIGKDLTEKIFSKLGIEPLSKEFNPSYLQELASLKRNRNRELKIFLMDQESIVGIGNIYASEICYQSRINPRKKVFSLSKKELELLVESIKDVLNKAIKARGTSISDYRDIEGEKGNYQELRMVYQKKGKSCPNCKGIIESFKQGQRTTFWCPACQK